MARSRGLLCQKRDLRDTTERDRYLARLVSKLFWHSPAANIAPLEFLRLTIRQRAAPGRRHPDAALHAGLFPSTPPEPISILRSERQRTVNRLHLRRPVINKTWLAQVLKPGEARQSGARVSRGATCCYHGSCLLSPATEQSRQSRRGLPRR